MAVVIITILSPLLAILALLLLVTSGLLYIPIGIFQWVVTAPISFTHEPVVTVGWTIARDFVNIFLVLIMIVIGVGTILRIKAYEAQRSLPMLIIAALLINFSPVICGLFIDVANIIMNVFKNPVLDVGNALGGQVAGIATFITDYFTSFGKNPMAALLDPAYINKAVGFVGLLCAGVISNVVTFIALSVYALIFILRIMVLWILVILSPFAFLGYAFPKLPFIGGIKKMWSEQFLQWTIIGIPLFFFLYVSRQIIAHPICTGTLNVGQGVFGEVTDALSGTIMCTILSTLFPSIFLILGAFLTFQTTAMGANAITGGVTKWAKSSGKNLGKSAWNTSKNWAIEKTPQSWKNAAEKMASTPLEFRFKGQGEKTLAGGAKSVAAWWLNTGAKPLGMGTQALGRAGMAAMNKPLSNEIANEEKEISEIKDKKERMSRVRQQGILDGKFTGRVLGAIKMGDVDDLTDAEIEKALKWAKEKDIDNSYKEFAKALPHLIYNDSDAKVDKEGLGGNDLLSERAAYQIRKATTKETIPNWSNKMLNNHIAMRAFIEHASPSQLNAFLTKFKYKGAEAIQRTIDTETILGGDHRSLTRKEYVDQHTSLGKTFGKKNDFLKLVL